MRGPAPALFVVLVMTLAALPRAAQAQPPPPAPQPPPPGPYQPPPGQYQPPPPGYYPPNQPVYPQQPYYPPPPNYQPYPQQPYPQQPYPQQPYPQQPTYTPPPPRPAPPPVEYNEPPVPTHAPKFSLWVGPRLSYMGFGLHFYGNEKDQSETTGNFLGNGVAAQVDVGVRIVQRYIPYVFYEHGFVGQGHRFEGSNASSSTEFYGIGLRHVSGDVNSVGFLTDLSIGKRTITVSNGSETYSMSGLEIFKLGLGLEIRLDTLFALTPLLTFAAGSMADADGNVTFSSVGSRDGLTHPRFKDGASIQDSRPYLVLSLGVGLHFDVFGK